MTKKDIEIARELKKRLSREVPLVEIKVFGSRARGDAELYSDLDVFLEVEEINSGIKDRIDDIVWEVGYENYVVISPLIFTRDEIENTPLRISPIVCSIAEEGVSV